MLNGKEVPELTTATITLPSGLHRATLHRMLDDTRGRAELLATTIRVFERKHGSPLETLEARLDRGEGSEQPDWEDSIEWRNALEALQRARELEGLLAWLLRSSAPSTSS